MNKRKFFFLILSLLLFASKSFANEKKALEKFKERLNTTAQNKESILKALGKPNEIETDAKLLKDNLKRAFKLKNKQGKPYLLETENIDVHLNQIDTLWTYDYDGFGKWASFFGIYFNARGEVIGTDWRVPKTKVFDFKEDLFFNIAPPQTDLEKLETILAWPFRTVRGIKQVGCEISKAPLNFLEVSWFLGPKAGWPAAKQKLKTAGSLFNYFFKSPGKQNPGTSIYRLICEIPVIGSFFEPPLKKEIPLKPKAYFLLGGIHQINDFSQRMDPLELYLKEALQTDAVYQIPWNDGTMMDVGYSTLNLSYGDSLVLAQKIVQRGNLQPGDSIALFAHSGAIQQILGIARILRQHQIYVVRAYGVAGVFVGGKAPIRKFEIIYNPDQDRFKWLLGFQLFTPGIQWKEVRGKEPSKGHEISGSIDKKNRLLYDGYFEEIRTFFVDSASRN